MEDRLVEDLVKEVAGLDVIPLIRLILGKSDVNEFKIAEQLGITVNQVRNMLYRLGAYNLVDFTRKKDKRKGWYIYYWTFDLRKAHDLILSLKHKKLHFLMKRLEKEKTDVFLKCVNECVRLDTANAMEYDFRCPECGELLTKEDAEKNIEGVNKEIEKTKLEIAEEEKRMFKEEKVKVEKKKSKKQLRKEKRKAIRGKKAEKSKKAKIAKKVAKKRGKFFKSVSKFKKLLKGKFLKKKKSGKKAGKKR